MNRCDNRQLSRQTGVTTDRSMINWLSVLLELTRPFFDRWSHLAHSKKIVDTSGTVLPRLSRTKKGMIWCELARTVRCCVLRIHRWWLSNTRLDFLCQPTFRLKTCLCWIPALRGLTLLWRQTLFVELCRVAIRSELVCAPCSTQQRWLHTYNCFAFFMTWLSLTALILCHNRWKV